MNFKDFDAIIDARTPAEFALDHIPGAVSAPVLDDAQRAEVGTLYKRVSPFEAKKLGGALVAQNVARHIDTLFKDRDRGWKPLIYCWRGGKRSGAMAHILREIGWDARTLEGGYRAYRRWVVEQLATLPGEIDTIVVHGPTGSGKSRFLGALRKAGAQVLDLEGLALHRGSVLGGLPGEYRHFLDDRAALEAQLDWLVALHGRERIGEWKALAAAGQWREFVERLLVQHYDPAYRRSSTRNFPQLADAPAVTIRSADDAAFARAAATTLEAPATA